ncbi:MAG: hypothetical protein M3Q92_07380, partial [Actinomycetota bacterium]|nr:hypothetical protein [Actinomycetota bacterium]
REIHRRHEGAATELLRPRAGCVGVLDHEAGGLGRRQLAHLRADRHQAADALAVDLQHAMQGTVTDCIMSTS